MIQTTKMVTLCVFNSLIYLVFIELKFTNMPSSFIAFEYWNHYEFFCTFCIFMFKIQPSITKVHIISCLISSMKSFYCRWIHAFLSCQKIWNIIPNTNHIPRFLHNYLTIRIKIIVNQSCNILFVSFHGLFPGSSQNFFMALMF